MNKEKLRKMVSVKLDSLYSDLLNDYSVKLGINEGYIPVDLAIKVDNLTDYVTDHVDEIMRINKMRQPKILDSNCGIEIHETSGVDNKGNIIKCYAFCDSVAPVDDPAMICDNGGHLIKFDNEDDAKAYLDSHLEELEALSVGQFYERGEIKEI